MRLRLSPTILDDVQTAIDDTLRRVPGDNFDPTDRTYRKIHEAKRTSAGVVIDADEADIKELVGRGRDRIDVANENLDQGYDVRHYQAQIRAWKALIRSATNS